MHYLRNTRLPILQNRVKEYTSIAKSLFQAIITASATSFIIPKPIFDDHGNVVECRKDRNDEEDDEEEYSQYQITHVTMQCNVVNQLLCLFMERDTAEIAMIERFFDDSVRNNEVDAEEMHKKNDVLVNELLKAIQHHKLSKCTPLLA